MEKVEEAELLVKALKSVNKIDSLDTSIDGVCAVNNVTLKLQEGVRLPKNLDKFFLNADSTTERNRKFKKELQSCLAPWRGTYNDQEAKYNYIFF